MYEVSPWPQLSVANVNTEYFLSAAYKVLIIFMFHRISIISASDWIVRSWKSRVLVRVETETE